MVAYAIKNRPAGAGPKTRKGIIWMILLLCLFFPRNAHAQQERTVAVLPFSVNAPESLDHLRLGVQEMLTTRLAGLGLSTVPPSSVNRHPLAAEPALRRADVMTLGRALEAHFLITGSLTQIGRTISLDVKALDVAGEKPPFSIFMVEEDVDRLAEAVERTAESLFNHIAGIAQIDSVRVTGNRRVESEAVLAVVESRRGEILDGRLRYKK